MAEVKLVYHCYLEEDYTRLMYEAEKHDVWALLESKPTANKILEV
jgi:hypothetical protein